MLDGYPTIELIDVVYNRIIESDTELTQLRAALDDMTRQLQERTEALQSVTLEYKMKVYRFLTKGEVLQAGDEWCEVYNGDEVWHPVTWSIGDALSACNDDTFRRPVTRVTDELTHLRADLATARADYAAALDTLNDATTELDIRRENLELCQQRLIAAENERNTYRAALEEIRTNYGKVCQEFELCEHPACESSYGAWAVADEALRAARVEPETDGEE